MQAFFCETIPDTGGILDANDSRHCISVLRKREGDHITLLDGKGSLAIAKITQAHARKCHFEIERVEKRETRDTRLHIAIAPTKSIDRFEFFLEKATEIGVEEITPLLCRYSERKIIKQERLHRILVAALKQSERLWLPKLNPLTSLQDFLKQKQEPANQVLAYVPEDNFLLRNFDSKVKNWLALVGPEGGFSEEEVLSAKAAGYIPTSLGNYRLRTETAGIVLASQVAQLSELI